MNRRAIPGRLLIIPQSGQSSFIIPSGKQKDVLFGKVFLSGRAPEDDPQVLDGDIIQYKRGGTNVRIDDTEMILIDYSQILYIY